MSTTEAFTIDGDILARVVNPNRGDLPQDLATVVLKFDFTSDDRDKMKALAEKARNGELSEQEQAELDGFVRVGQFISMMKSKARVSLQSRPSA